MIENRPRNSLTLLFAALAISLVVHFALFVVVAVCTNEASIVVRVTEAMLTPAEAITEHIAPGHSGVQIFFGFTISVVLYTVTLWPIAVLMSLRRRKV
jgi:hypothetical protein